MRKQKMANTIQIRIFNDLDEVFFKQLISMVKNGIDDHKIHSNPSSDSLMTQKELHEWIKNDDEGCLSTIQEYLKKENLVNIADLANKELQNQVEEAFLDTLFDAIFYLATKPNDQNITD